MQTNSFVDQTVIVSTQRNQTAQPSQTGPVELDLIALQSVAGGLTPRGGWSAEAIVADTDGTPRGGWL